MVNENSKNAVGKSVIKGCGERLRKERFADINWMACFRRRYPSLVHAVRKIDVNMARSLPGVAAALTYEDNPGTNAYGIIVKDQPVLVADKVRCKGDALAIVAAETEAIASKALELIELDCEEIPAVYSVKDAMRDDAPRVHAAGNIWRKRTVRRCGKRRLLRDVITNNYSTQLVEHRYIEPKQALPTWMGMLL